MHIHLIVGEVDDVELAVDGFVGRMDAVEVHVLMECQEFLVVGGHFGGAIKNWGAEVVHAAVVEGFEYHFIAYAVDVALSDGQTHPVVIVFFFHISVCIDSINIILFVSLRGDSYLSAGLLRRSYV